MTKNIELKTLKPEFIKLIKKFSSHLAFAALLAVLLAYLFVAWRISRLATAEPTTSAANSAQAVVPKVDKSAINQIQQLEQISPDVHSLFDSARNNPFSE